MQIITGHHTGLSVSSIDESLVFYRDLLGLKVIFSWNPNADYIRTVTGYKDADICVAVLQVPETEFYIELLEYRKVKHAVVDHRNGNPGIAHLAFFVDNVDQWFSFLTSRGIQSVSMPVTPEKGPNKGGRIVYMIDPDGFRVELIQSPKTFAEFNPESN